MPQGLAALRLYRYFFVLYPNISAAAKHGPEHPAGSSWVLMLCSRWISAAWLVCCVASLLGDSTRVSTANSSRGVAAHLALGEICPAQQQQENAFEALQQKTAPMSQLQMLSSSPQLQKGNAFAKVGRGLKASCCSHNAFAEACWGVFVCKVYTMSQLLSQSSAVSAP